MSGNIERFWRRMGGEIERRAAPRLARIPATVVAVESDHSTGVPTSIRATLDEGGAEVAVPIPRGTGVREGVKIELTQAMNDPTGPLTWGGITSADDPSVGHAELADLPAPLWAMPDHTTALAPHGTSTLTV